MFAAGSVEIAPSEQVKLNALIQNLNNQQDTRVQLLAFSEGDPAVRSRARRVSLSRGRAVRAFLIDQGIESTRIDVRAMGDKTESEPRDRVDVVIMQR
jgi:outer membrane protein OmpA-like peptidoglycan-associated protein